MKGVAYKTVAFYSNPGIFGTANFDSADVNVRCNPPSYSQPGCWLGDPVYGHSFAAYLCAALCAGFQCYADQGNNLNAVDNHNITAGNYVLTTTKCFPYCLNKKGWIGDDLMCVISLESKRIIFRKYYFRHFIGKWKACIKCRLFDLRTRVSLSKW